ncbi:alpha/beta hydrolase [Azorhizobium doebereinerae]|uniref:alpha/beta hydrolase n=1 Tax=Azorhizobium doebereinerae TaxID=281091 RepID=UPI000410B28D|nr:alpha/beta hydrolase-fold protein [Azorhizobium doebereinerae]
MDAITLDARPALMPETVQFDLAPRAGGPPYRIFLRIPPGAAPASGWPTLYMLDGNAVAGTAAEALRVQADYPTGTGIREGALISIGYPTDGAYDSVRRSWDMGPPPGATYPPHSADGPPVRTGGADHFLAFIEDELKPEIARRLPVDLGRQALFGHSFGGLCVLHALFTRPAAFAHFIAISPAIWWEDAVVLKSEALFAAAPRPARVFLAAAEYEQALAPFHERLADPDARRARYASNRVVDNARELAGRLGALPGVHAEFALFEGETHMSVLPIAINRAIRFALGPDAP